METDEYAEHSHEMAAGTFWGLFGNFFTKIIAFLYTVYVARMVTQGDVGLFYLALGIVGLVGVWRDFGLPAALTRYVPYFESRGEYRKATELLKNTYLVNAAVSIALTAIIWVCAGTIGEFYKNPLLPEALRLIAAYTLLENLFRINGSYIQGKADIKFNQMVGTTQVLAKLAFTFVLFQIYGPTLPALIAAFLCSYVLGTIVSLPWIYSKATKGNSGAGLDGKELYREIVPLGLMLTVLQTFYGIIASTDRVILGYLAPQASANEMVAIYSMATTVGVNLMVFPGAVGGIFLPVISRLVGKDDKKGIHRQVGVGQRWVLFITLPMAAVMMVFAQEMLGIFYGQGYSTGGGAMALVVLGLVFAAFTYTISLALAGMRLVKLELKVAAAAGIANVALNFALIPSFGVEGAALAAAASFAISAVLFLHYGKKVIGFETPASSYRLLVAGAITCAAIFLLKPEVTILAGMIPSSIGGAGLAPYISKSLYLGLLGLMCALAFAIFGLLSLLLKCFEREDVAVAKRMAKQGRVPDAAISIAEKVLLHGIAVKKGGA
ncbi:MAG: flippase [Candidatus Micrarchaeia archaeon]